jgi:hypothetical protein
LRSSGAAVLHSLLRGKVVSLAPLEKDFGVYIIVIDRLVGEPLIAVKDVSNCQEKAVIRFN